LIISLIWASVSEILVMPVRTRREGSVRIRHRSARIRTSVLIRTHRLATDTLPKAVFAFPGPLFPAHVPERLQLLKDKRIVVREGSWSTSAKSSRFWGTTPSHSGGFRLDIAGARSKGLVVETRV
jgi:hypothetical protein